MAAKIRAVLVSESLPARLGIGLVDGPLPAPGEALVRVKAVSLNPDEVRVAQTLPVGSRIGWDIAGVVERPADDGSGPATGQRVVGFVRRTGWAELVAVQTSNLAVLPESISFSIASTLPIAGLTALYALDRAPGLLARRVLITGASGGVGMLAVQMAAHGGARVTALVRQKRYADEIARAGAQVVITDQDGATLKDFGPFDLALESVGGRVLSNLPAAMAPSGLIVTYGAASGESATLDPRLWLVNIQGLFVFNDMAREGAGAGLSRLVWLVERGALRPHISVETDWTQVGTVAQRLRERGYPGKAVLLID